MKIEKKSFYFIKDKYFDFINDPFLSCNKKSGRYRPSYLAIIEKNGLIWFIPVTSKYEKYKKLFDEKISKYGICDTIVLGELLGKHCAFLIQNIFPVTKEFIKKKYVQKMNGIPVRIENKLSKQLIKKSKRIITLVRKGNKNLVFTNIIEIEKQLKKDK